MHSPQVRITTLGNYEGQDFAYGREKSVRALVNWKYLTTKLDGSTSRKRASGVQTSPDASVSIKPQAEG